MQHPNDSHVIEAGSDITKLHEASVWEKDGRKLALLLVELRPDKLFSNAAHAFRLHVTNGVNPRTLLQEHAALMPNGEGAMESPLLPQQAQEGRRVPSFPSSAPEPKMTAAALRRAAQAQQKGM